MKKDTRAGVGMAVQGRKQRVLEGVDKFGVQ